MSYVGVVLWGMDKRGAFPLEDTIAVPAVKHIPQNYDRASSSRGWKRNDNHVNQINIGQFPCILVMIKLTVKFEAECVVDWVLSFRLKYSPT